MLKRIEIENAFAHKHTKIDFEPGLTRLFGPNEIGKSQVFEMVQWALFGNKALRTPSEDYKDARVTLTFQVGSDEYRVVRTIGNALMHDADGKLEARGTTAVNRRVITLLGYGLKTFQNVNAIQQDEVQKLTRLRADERKKFLDELIGVNQIDALVKDYKSEQDGYATEVRVLSEALVTVLEPKPPEGYTSAKLLGLQLQQAERLMEEVRQAESRVSQLERTLRQIVVLRDPLPHLTEEQLNEEVRKTSDSVNLSRSLNHGLVTLYEAAGDINITEVLSTLEALRALDRIQKPRYNQKQIDDFRKQYHENQLWLSATEMRSRIEALEGCPGLSEQVETLRSELAEIAPKASPHRGLPSLESLNEEERVLVRYNEVLEDLATLDPGDLKHARILLPHTATFTKEQWEETVKAMKTLATIMPLTDLNSSLRAKQRIAERDAAEEDLLSAREALAALDPSDTRRRLDDLRTQHQRAVTYELSYKYYEEVQEKNKELEKKLSDASDKLVETQAITKALSGFKYYVNTYFLPAVSKAASAMLTTMTNGTRRTIYISDKFEIQVDGRSVEGLSGSTKAIVNIALRFALQYVLTRNTFSVFMADEVDGSMDDNRARYLNECLSTMTQHVKQVIVISHKPITATHNINLGA